MLKVFPRFLKHLAFPSRKTFSSSRSISIENAGVRRGFGESGFGKLRLYKKYFWSLVL